jgi:hypothetical protein
LSSFEGDGVNGTPLQRGPDQGLTSHHVGRRADQEFAETYGIELDPEPQDFYLRLDPLTW